MSSGYARAGANANLRGETPFTAPGNSFHPVAAVMRAVHAVKIDIIATLTGRDPRTVKYWRKRLRGMSATDLTTLLRDRHYGPAIRDALLAGVDWHEAERAMIRVAESQEIVRQERAELYRRQKLQRRRLDES